MRRILVVVAIALVVLLLGSGVAGAAGKPTTVASGKMVWSGHEVLSPDGTTEVGWWEFDHSWRIVSVGGTMTGTFTFTEYYVDASTGVRQLSQRQTSPISSARRVSPGVLEFVTDAYAYNGPGAMSWATTTWRATDGAARSADVLERGCFIHGDFHTVDFDTVSVKIR